MKPSFYHLSGYLTLQGMTSEYYEDLQGFGYGEGGQKKGEVEGEIHPRLS